MRNMKKKLFLLNIGNTHTGSVIWDDGRFGRVSVTESASVDASLLPEDIPAAAVCVVPEIRDRLSGRGVFFLDPAAVKSVDFSRVRADQLGADRAANALAAAELCELGALVLDFGTAITAEIVDENRVFRGGAIMPGRMLMRRALNDHTAQLPLTGLLSAPPERAGTDTISSIGFGVDRGALGMVRETVRAFEAEFGTFKSIVGVGGDAGFFLAAEPRMIFGGETFTFRGLLRGYFDVCGVD